jgi:hypothetical protein
MSESFPILNIIYGFDRNSNFVIQELIMKDFMFFKR